MPKDRHLHGPVTIKASRRAKLTGGTIERTAGAIEDITAFQRACAASEPLNVQPIIGVNIGARTAKALRKVFDGRNARDTRVTGAIHKAERLLDDTIAAWEAVEAAERAIAQHTDTPRDERGFAEHGVGTARTTVSVLKALRGRT